MAYTSSTFAQRTLAFMMAGLVVLLIILATAVWLASRASQHTEEVAQEREIRSLASRMLTTMVDVETAQRGYLLTDDRAYLAPYENARGRFDIDFKALRERAASNTGLVLSLDKLGQLAEAKFKELAQTIELQSANRHDEAVALVRTDRGKLLMDDIRSVSAGLVAAAEVRVVNRLSELDTAVNRLTWITLVGGGLIILFAAGAIWTVLKYTRELLDARREVETMNADLEGRVAERTVEVSRANDEIQRFAYIVSHDLRAPLVNVMGFTSELEVGAKALETFVAAGADAAADVREAARLAASEDIPEAVRFIRASTAKMDGLINAILRLSREGRRELKAQFIDLGKLFSDAAQTVQHQLDSANARIELAGKFPSIVSDRLAIEQVFGNLIDNAVKYLSPDRPGLITLAVEDKGPRINVSVADNGRGIDEKDYERIFELFRRAGAQDRPGEGVGLAHVRALVRRLGGDITVRSRVGEGTSFDVDLPKKFNVNNERSTTL